MTTVTIEPESKLAEALREAAETGHVLVIRAGDTSYTMNIKGGSVQSDDRKPIPEEGEAFRAALDAAFGTWDDARAEEFKAYIRERRKSGSRPSVKL